MASYAKPCAVAVPPVVFDRVTKVPEADDPKHQQQQKHHGAKHSKYIVPLVIQVRILEHKTEQAMMQLRHGDSGPSSPIGKGARGAFNKSGNLKCAARPLLVYNFRECIHYSRYKIDLLLIC